MPLNLSRVQAWADHAFSDGPVHLRDCTVVMVPTPDEDIVGLKGKWKQVSPEELTHGFILKLSQRILAKGQVAATEDELNLWKSVALSWPMQFEVILGEDKLYWPPGCKCCSARIVKLVSRFPFLHRSCQHNNDSI